MGSLCGSNTQTSTTTQAPPAWLQQAYQDLIAQAQGVSNNIQGASGPYTAGLDQNQINAISGISNTVGTADPYFSMGLQALQGGLGTVAGGLGYLPGAQNLFGQAQGQYGTANQYLGSAAGQYGAANNMVGSAAGTMGSALPYFGQGASYASQGAAPINAMMVSPGTVSPTSFGGGDALQQYMSPYQQNVIDTTLANIQHNNQVQRNDLTGSAILGGNAFGGDRAGVAQAELARGQDAQTNATLASLNNQNYAQALGEFNQQQGVNLGAQEYNVGTGLQGQEFNSGQNLTAQQSNMARLLQASGLYGTMGQGIAGVGQGLGSLAGIQGSIAGGLGGLGSAAAGIASGLGGLGSQYAGLGSLQAGIGSSMGGLGSQIAGLGPAQQSSQLQALQALLQGGTLAQQNQQQQATSQYQSYLNSIGLGGLQTIAPILTGIGSQAGGTGTTTAPGPNIFSQLGSLGLGALGIGKMISGNMGGRINADGDAYDDGGAVGYGGIGSLSIPDQIGIHMSLGHGSGLPRPPSLQPQDGIADLAKQIQQMGPAFKAMKNSAGNFGGSPKTNPALVPIDSPEAFGGRVGLGEMQGYADGGDAFADRFPSDETFGRLGLSDLSGVSPVAAEMAARAKSMPDFIRRLPGSDRDTDAAVSSLGPIGASKNAISKAQMLKDLLATNPRGLLSYDDGGPVDPFADRFGGDDPVDHIGEDAPVPLAYADGNDPTKPTRGFEDINIPYDAPGVKPNWNNAAVRGDVKSPPPDPANPLPNSGLGDLQAAARSPLPPPPTIPPATDPYADAAARVRRRYDRPPVDDAAPASSDRPTLGKPDPWMAVAAAGFAGMAARSPWALTNLGEAGLAGLKNYSEQKEQAQKQYSVDLRAKQLADESSRHREQLDLERDKLNTPSAYQQLRLDQLAQQEKDRVAATKYQMLPGQGTDPDTGQTVPGTYVFDPKTAKTEFRPGVNLTQKQAAPSTFDPATKEILARQIIGGDWSGMTNLGRGAQGDQKITEVRNLAANILTGEMKMAPKDAANYLSEKYQEFKATGVGKTAEARTSAVREANLNLILRAADAAIPAALEASDKVGRTGWVPINKLIQSGQVIASNPELKEFGMANLQLAEHWARAMNPTGVMRESDRDKALGFLSTADSPETYKRAVMQLQKQITRERDAVRSGRNPSPDDYRKELEGKAGTGSPAAKDRPVIKSKSEYDSLPSGSTFVGSDGKTYRKP